MQNRKPYAVLALAAMASMVLAACSQPAPVVQTVVVRETAAPAEAQVVESTVVVRETQVVEVTAAPAAEWTTPHPILSDVRVRQALAHCTDPNELIGSVYGFLPEEDRAKQVMDTFIPKDSPWYAKNINPDANIIQYTFDITRAGELLDEAGWTLGEGAAIRANAAGEPLALRFTTTNAPFRQTWGAVWVSQMQKCGVQLLPSYIPGSIWFGGNSGLRRRDFDIGAFAWVGETEPPGNTLYACDQIPTPANTWNGQNYMGWCNETASTAIKLGNNTLNLEERQKQYVTVQEEFSKDMVSLPLFQRLEATAYNKALTGIKPDATEYWSANAHELEMPGKTTIVAALGQEPASLFLLQESSAVGVIVGQLIYGADTTQYSYGFQNVGLEGEDFPRLENGGATETEVEIKDGDVVVNADGDVGTFKDGKLTDADGNELNLKVKNAAGEDIDLVVGAKVPQLSVTFKYTPRKWSDGEDLKNADFELGHKVACDRESGAVSYFVCDRTASYETLADGLGYTVTYVPGYLLPTYFLPAFGYYPSHQVIETEGEYKGKTLAEVAPVDFKNLPEVTEKPVSTGPYFVESWEKGSRITLKANPNFYLGAPKAEEFVVQIFDGNPAGAVAALLQGTVDIVGKEVVGAGQELETVLKEGEAGTIAAEPIASPTWEHADFNLNVR
jgi:ABC-type transport system substrate-binding protein